jgi:hypothetical protein
VILNNGLEEIGKWAFAYCRSLVRIITPPALKAIDDEDFKECLNLKNCEVLK